MTILHDCLPRLASLLLWVSSIMDRLLSTFDGPWLYPAIPFTHLSFGLQRQHLLVYDFV
jgi:hypothetical protein